MFGTGAGTFETFPEGRVRSCDIGRARAVFVDIVDIRFY